MLVHVNKPIRVNERGQIPLLDFHFSPVINLLSTYSPLVFGDKATSNQIIDSLKMDVRTPW